MTIRERTEEQEFAVFSPYASFSRNSRGRDREEEPCDIRTVYQRDRDRILHSKSFRRLKQKTQVFLIPEGDHYRTRLTHTLEVAQLARTIAKALRLNEDLADAIALGHDLGHTPFGHAGERALNAVCPFGFAHFEQSVRIVELLEKKGEGLNLTWEVRDGIRNHRTSGTPHTLEGQIVRYCDKIAYINHDIDDALRAGILKEEDIPEESRMMMGDTTGERLNTLIHDVVRHSEGRNTIAMSDMMEAAMKYLRAFMFQHVYNNPAAKREEEKAVRMIQELYRYYNDYPEQMPDEYQYLMREKGEPRERVVCDYIAGMTDLYSIHVYKELFVPKSWQG
ncbi:deoxyguanosinetriphosphate triphosphohydrolase [Parablautia sp. Marseille-Q6255]|uniref:deoxyguanosinetriphosphate triphosphohydrolase n=1 Tax=Parablautia sp. Marseille-Q6255 TaxID=3039593 RepID=UPI0024BCCD19|nr:deoxyguanosinetriphosphate triphosphohydrolase [Parablautia sp. Marseille-Q6255]